MNGMKWPRNMKVGATLMAMLACVQVAAQSDKIKPANDKLMTRAELRTCFKQQDTMKGEREAIDQDRSKIDAERASLLGERDVLAKTLAALEMLKVEGAAIDAANVEAINAFNQKAATAVSDYNQKKVVVDGKIDAWNSRNAASKARENAFNETHQQWKDQCSNRRYREDDEKAVRAGK